jgi:hypothetical protein
LNVTFLKRPLKNLLKFIRNKRRKHSDIYRFNEVCWLLDLPNPFYKFGMLQTQTQRAICNGYNKALHIIMKRDQLDVWLSKWVRHFKTAITAVMNRVRSSVLFLRRKSGKIWMMYILHLFKIQKLMPCRAYTL